MDMRDVILRNSEPEQYICAARKNFKLKNELSESTSKLLICHFSDMHGDVERFDNVMELIEYYKPEFAIHTGDLTVWNSSDNTDFFFQKTDGIAVPVYNVIGNHETFDNNGSLTNEYLHNRYVAPLKNINCNAEKGWYYTDFESRKIRLIVLNAYEYFHEKYNIRCTMAFLQEQCEWVADALKGASEKNYAVIIAAHEFAEKIPAGSNDFGFCQRFMPHPWGMPKERKPNYIIEDIVDAFKHGKALKKEYICDLSGETISIDCNFDNCGEFICYLGGHHHGDYAGYLPHHNDQLSITMTCSGCFPPNYHNIGDECSDLPRIPGTISEDAVNFYVIDRENKKISIIRVGATVNDLMEKRVVLTLPYEAEGRI
jgi:predicted phosphodiesterase